MSERSERINVAGLSARSDETLIATPPEAASS
jgi:hypothetical protein